VREFANNATALVAVFGEPDLGLFLKRYDGFTKLDGFQEAVVN